MDKIQSLSSLLARLSSEGGLYKRYFFNEQRYLALVLKAICRPFYLTSRINIQAATAAGDLGGIVGRISWFRYTG